MSLLLLFPLYIYLFNVLLVSIWYQSYRLTQVSILQISKFYFLPICIFYFFWVVQLNNEHYISEPIVSKLAPVYYSQSSQISSEQRHTRLKVPHTPPEVFVTCHHRPPPAANINRFKEKPPDLRQKAADLHIPVKISPICALTRPHASRRLRLFPINYRRQSQSNPSTLASDHF